MVLEKCCQMYHILEDHMVISVGGTSNKTKHTHQVEWVRIEINRIICICICVHTYTYIDIYIGSKALGKPLALETMFFSIFLTKECRLVEPRRCSFCAVAPATEITLLAFHKALKTDSEPTPGAFSVENTHLPAVLGLLTVLFSLIVLFFHFVRDGGGGHICCYGF